MSQDGSETFLGLAAEDSTFERARVLVQPIPYEGTASYGRGAAAGPSAILWASAYVETYDEELDLYIEDYGYNVLPGIAPDPAGADETSERIYLRTRETLDRAGDRFLLTLGGEHSVTPGVVRAFAERNEGLSVLHIDAHADLREEYEGARNSHACACRRIRDHVERTVSVGVRSLSLREAGYVRENGVPVFFAKDIQGRRDWIGAVVDELSDDVYVTFDLDALDPSIMPATGTPEPGGLSWYGALALLRETARRKRIVGADVVELAPIPGMHAPDFLAAKLAVKTVAYARESEIRDACSGPSPDA